MESYMLKILLVSISSPPKSDPESIQVGRYIKYLSRIGCSIDLITSKNPTLYMETDSELEEYLNDISQKFEIALFEYRYLNFLLRKINPSILQFPDPKWSFSFHTIPKSFTPDIIYSRSYPLSSTLLALKIKKRLGNTPWVLHLSDPWAVSFNGPSPATNFKKLPRKWNKRKEIECFSLASKISMTSKKTIELYSSEYPQFKDKFILTPNVFDDEKISNEEISFEGKLNIVYTGGFGEKRNPDFLLKGILQFLNHNKSARHRINFTFTGPMTRENESKFQSLNNTNQIKHLGIVSFTQMINIQRKAHVLINIDSNITDPRHSVFFPSKLLEYFAARRRILAIGTILSVTHDIVTESFGDFVEINDDQRLQEILVLYWEKFMSGDKQFFTTENKISQYGAQHNAKRLKRVFDQLINHQEA